MGKFRKSEQLAYWRFFLLLFLAGFVLGIVFVNLVWRFRTQDIETLSLFSSGEGGRTAAPLPGYLWYLTQKRMGIMLVWHLTGITILGTFLVAAGLLWTGFLCGTLSAIAVLQLGLRGIAVLTAAFLPQIFLYVPAGLWYLTCVWQMSEKSREGGRLNGRLYKGFLLSCLAPLAVFFCGILVECYVNPYILDLLLY